MRARRARADRRIAARATATRCSTSMPSSSCSSRASASRGRFAGLELAAREFPVARVRPCRADAARAARRHRRARSPPRRLDSDVTLTPCRASGRVRRPSARANCQATRPLREPRCSANCSASRCAPRPRARIAGAVTPKCASQRCDRGEVVVLRERIERDPQAEALGQRDLFLDRFAGMDLLADVPRLEVLGEVLGQQMAAVRRRVDQHVRRRAPRSSRRASPSAPCSRARRRRTRGRRRTR